MSLILYIGLTLVVLGSGLAVLYLKLGLKDEIKLLLSFSGAFLLAMSILHLLPEVYEQLHGNAGIFILAGFLFQLFLEYFSKGIEHGHIHIEDEKKHQFPLAIYISLCLHSLLEGMPIHDEGHEVDGHIHANNLIVGIVLHKIPVAIVLMTLFVRTGMKRSLALFWFIGFALMMPLGTLISHWFGEAIEGTIHDFHAIVLGLILGVFLHVSTTILFESSSNHRFHLYKLLVILLGMGVAYISV